jgi:tyrosyl-tRNA synthetase
MGSEELILRNVVDAMTEEEISELAANATGKRAYVGYEPSGVLHLGHMLTANKLIDLQETGMEVVVLLADIHAYLNDHPF